MNVKFVINNTRLYILEVITSEYIIMLTHPPKPQFFHQFPQKSTKISVLTVEKIFQEVPIKELEI